MAHMPRSSLQLRRRQAVSWSCLSATPAQHQRSSKSNDPSQQCALLAAGTCPTAVIYTAGDYLPRLADARCPFPACPCTAGGKARCESLEGGARDVLDGNSSSSSTLVHIVRSPLDVVLSAFFFHRQVCPCCSWFSQFPATHFVQLDCCCYKGVSPECSCLLMLSPDALRVPAGRSQHPSPGSKPSLQMRSEPHG